MIIKFYQESLKKNIKNNMVLFGQNITYGSRISGITEGIEKLKNVKIINTQNSEYSLIGFGFGIMLNKAKAIYFAKQIDFLLLGLDHIINTYNYILHRKEVGGFSIITYIVDSGYEGPQSRLHCLSEFSSMSFANCHYLVFPDDIALNLKLLNKNGFNIFCLSQKYSKLKDLKYPKIITKNKLNNIFLYKKGLKGVVVAYGFAAYEAYRMINKKKLDVDFYVVTNPSANFNKEFIDSISSKKFLYIFDDSRSKIKSCSQLSEKILIKNNKIEIKYFLRKENRQKLLVNSDNYRFS